MTTQKDSNDARRPLMAFQMEDNPDSYPLKKVLLEVFELEAYIKVMEEAIKAMREKTVLDVESIVKDWWNLDPIDLDDVSAEPLAHPLTTRLRTSTLISQYSLLEDNLINFCEYLSQKTTKKFDKKSRERAIIDNARNYLSSSLRVDLSKTDELWDEIIQVRRVRNLIVHENGYIRSEDGKKGIYQHNTLSKLIAVDMLGKVIVRQGTNQYMNRVMLGFFYNLNEALKESGYFKENPDN